MPIFKAYDIRGQVPDELSPKEAFAIGYGFAGFLAQENKKSSPQILLGHDMRTHAPELVTAFISGAKSFGAEVFLLGLCTTPMFYFSVHHFEKVINKPIDGGVMVTASHNGPSYNGFKLCRQKALPISGDSGLQDIQARALKSPNLTPLPLPCELKVRSLETEQSWSTRTLLPNQCEQESQTFPELLRFDFYSAYAQFLSGFQRKWPQDLRIAIDPSNAMGCLYLPILQQMGADIVVRNDHLDGTFPAHEADPIKNHNMQTCVELVKAHKTKLGASFDGDGDRIVIVDERAEIIPGDVLTGILALAFLQRFPGSSILYDLRSSRSVQEAIETHGGRAIRNRVGHSFMKASMRKNQALFGGELSGHYYFSDAFYADSAILALIELLNVLGESKLALSELTAQFKRYTKSEELNYRVKDKEKVLSEVKTRYSEFKSDELDGLSVEAPEWWFNLRPSNTEALLRLNIEAKDKNMLKSKIQELEEIIAPFQEV